MEYDMRKYETFDEVFREGLRIAQEEDISEAQKFWKAYIQFIYEDADDIHTLEEAAHRARNNFGYYAGYFGVETRKLISDTYCAYHPIFG